MTEQIGLKHLIIGIIITVILVLTPPLLVYKLTGRFTYHFEEVFEELEKEKDQEQYLKVKEYCKFNVIGTRYGYECDRPCMRHSLDGKDCVPKGCVKTGFLSSECDLYVCKGYGDVQPQCLEHWHGSKEDYCKENPDDKWYCRF